MNTNFSPKTVIPTPPFVIPAPSSFVIPAQAGIQSILFLFLFFASASLPAQPRSGLSFLKIGVGARSLGLGESFTALANDASSIYWNPAGLSSIRQTEISAMHSKWLLGSTFGFLGWARPFQNQTLGFGLSFLSNPPQDGRDSEGRPTGQFGATDMAATVSLGRPVSQNFSLGTSLKFIQSRIAQYQAQGFALDLGVKWSLKNSFFRHTGPLFRHSRESGNPVHPENHPFSLALTLQNLGPSIKFLEESTPLPLTLSLGSAYSLAGSMVLAADIKTRIYDKTTNFSVGTEYRLLPSLSLRGGYQGQSQGPSSYSGLGAGIGLKFQSWTFDYALAPFAELGTTQRVSINARFR